MQTNRDYKLATDLLTRQGKNYVYHRPRVGDAMIVSGHRGRRAYLMGRYVYTGKEYNHGPLYVRDLEKERKARVKVRDGPEARRATASRTAVDFYSSDSAERLTSKN